MLVILVIGGICLAINNKSENKIAINGNNVSNSQEIKEELKRIAMVNGKLYYDTEKESNEFRCGMIDGKITSNIKSTEIPTIDNQSNFEGEYGYQYGRENTIEICIDGKWKIFETK